MPSVWLIPVELWLGLQANSLKKETWTGMLPQALCPCSGAASRRLKTCWIYLVVVYNRFQNKNFKLRSRPPLNIFRSQGFVFCTRTELILQSFCIKKFTPGSSFHFSSLFFGGGESLFCCYCKITRSWKHLGPLKIAWISNSRSQLTWDPVAQCVYHLLCMQKCSASISHGISR